jgi:hypothetical protein
MIQLTGTMKKVLTYIGIGIVGVIVLSVTVAYFYQRAAIANLNKEKIELQQKEQTIIDDYNQKLGMAKANELAAREDKLLSDAKVSEYERRMGNAKAVDAKIDSVEAKYEQAKQDMGECENQQECLDKLCRELMAAGFKVNCK